MVTQSSSGFSGQASVGTGCILTVASTVTLVPVAGVDEACEVEVVDIEDGLLFSGGAGAREQGLTFERNSRGGQ